MTAIATAAIVFACAVAGALLGMFLSRLLPEGHLRSDSKDVVRLGMGLLATIAGMVLGLLVASAKGSYDAQSSELTQMAANVALLDRLLAHYGSESKDARDLLRMSVARAIDQMWPQGRSQAPELNPAATGGEPLYDKIQALTPQSDAQRFVRADALKVATDIGRMRSLLFAQAGSSIPVVFLVILIFWLSVLFLSFGLFAPPNATVIVALMVSALSVSTAVLLILELDQPFTGLLQVSSAPLRATLAHLGQ